MVDVKRAINALHKLEPEVSKAFRAEAKDLAEPALAAARDAYAQLPLSGMARKWPKDRPRFPFDVNKARNGIKFRFDTRRKAVGVILVEQKDPATAIFETAGRANVNPLSTALDAASNRGWAIIRPGRTRLIGPAVYTAARRGVTDNIKRLILNVSRTIESRI
jgi:hypothetical protein